MPEKTNHPVNQPSEPESGHEPVVYSTYLEEGHGPMERMRKEAGKVEEIKIGSSRLDELPFHLMGAGGYEYTLEKTNDEIREDLHRMDTKKQLEAAAAAGPAGNTKKKSLF